MSRIRWFPLRRAGDAKIDNRSASLDATEPTKRTPAGRWGDVNELVGAAVFLASDAASFVNGQTIFVDGGITASL